MRAVPAGAAPVTWCLTWASSPPATTSLPSGIQGPTRSTRSRCGSAHLRSGAARGRPDRAGGAEGRRARRAGRPGGRRGRPGGRLAGCGRAARFTEYGSPHGGSWLSLLAERGLTPAAPGEPADVIVDCFGMMHAADQAAALGGARRRAVGDRGPAAAVPRAERDRPVRPVERAAPCALRVLLHHRAGRPAGGARPAARQRLAVRPLWRHRTAGSQPGSRARRRR